MGSPYGGKRSSHSTLSGTRFKMLHLQPHGGDDQSDVPPDATFKMSYLQPHGGDDRQCAQPCGICKCPCSKYMALLTCRGLLHLCEQEQWHKEPQITRRMWRADFTALRPGLRKHLAQLQNIGTRTSISGTDSVPQVCKKAVKHEEPAAASSCSHMCITQMCVSRSAHQELNVSGSYLYNWLEQA